MRERVVRGLRRGGRCGLRGCLGERRDGREEGAEERDGLWWFTHTSSLLDTRYKSRLELGCLKYPIDIKTVTVKMNCELECMERKVMCTVKILASSSID